MNNPFDGFFSEGVRARFSDRRVDFSLPQGDEGGFTAAQKSFLQSEWALAPERCVNIRQVHGSTVLRIDASLNHCLEADGMITNQKNLALLIRTADCLPVFLHDVNRGVIGLVHAGWRGSKEKIVTRAIEAMVEHFGTQARDVKAAFGPAISPVFYEVGREFISIFPGEVQCHGLTCFLDLALVNRRQLESAGVLAENIYDCGICTFANEQYHSYRRDGALAGRLVSSMIMQDINKG